MGVFMATSTSYMQGLSALFILLVSLILQLAFNPYENTALNIMEATVRTPPHPNRLSSSDCDVIYAVVLFL